MIHIVDYGLGNLGSIQNMLSRLGVESLIAEDPAMLQDAQKIILPGVGTFDVGMNNLERLGWREVLDKKVKEEGAKILGICLGMQLMTKRSEEGTLPGLGWISAITKKFTFEAASSYKVPHMGWNIVQVAKESRILEKTNDEKRFYFVHSYYVELENKKETLGTTDFGGSFCSAFEVGNIIGVQFHPEKSHKFGMQLLRNFADN